MLESLEAEISASKTRKAENFLKFFYYLKNNTVFTAKNTVILPNFLVWKFCGKAQFL